MLNERATQRNANSENLIKSSDNGDDGDDGDDHDDNDGDGLVTLSLGTI